MKPSAFALGAYACGACGAPMRIEPVDPVALVRSSAPHLLATCYAHACAFYDTTIRIPLTRIECDVLEENPRDAASPAVTKLPHTPDI